MHMRGKLILIVGSTGSGKGTLMRHAMSRFPGITTPQSYTSRPRRSDAVENTHYTFVSETEFKEKIARGEFLEWAEFSGNYYGTLKADIEDGLKKGTLMLKEMEVQGVRQVQKLLPHEDLIVVFINAGSWDELAKRALAREAMDDATLNMRRLRYEDELTFMPEADVVIQNLPGKQDDAMAAFEDVIAKAMKETHHE
jgi:guanylate kinase